MRNIRLLLEYDGTGFFGFQKQKKKGLPTIQDELEHALETLMGEKVKTVTAGRTDTGVHALGQVVSFKTESSRDPSTIKKALNGLLPETIIVKEVQEAPYDFHARFSARFRLYHYYILNRDISTALGRSYLFHVRKPLDIEKMQEASCFMTGERDFTSFCSAVKEVETTVRRISHIKIYRFNEAPSQESPVLWPQDIAKDLIVFEFRGKSFLHSMVRLMVATLVRVGEGKIPPSEVEHIISMKKSGLIKTNVPPCGLFLIKVEY